MGGTTVTLDYGELRAAITVLRDSVDDLTTAGRRLDGVPTSGAVYAHAGLTTAVTRVVSALRDRNAALVATTGTIADGVEFAVEAFQAADQAEAESLARHAAGLGTGNAPRPV